MFSPRIMHAAVGKSIHPEYAMVRVRAMVALEA
jgi:hypothetical protein